MYASFDSTAAQPTPVTGWYDAMTPACQLVHPANLLTLTQAEWDNRLATPFVQNGLLVTAPVPTTSQLLAQAQTVQIGILAAAYAQAIQHPVSYTSKGGVTETYQADIASQGVLATELAVYASIGVTPTGFYWVAADNTQVPFALSDLQGLAGVMGMQGWPAFEHLQTQKAAVLAATTVAAVQAVVW